MGMSNPSNSEATTIIVGASAAGLASAACLKRHGVDFILLEQGEQVAGCWRNHYDRLHLHTNRGLSGLPYRPMPAGYPRYPSRDQMVAYLEAYAEAFTLVPRFGQTAVLIEPGGDGWITHTQDASYRSRSVVIATGNTRRPHMPSFPGVDRFHGAVLHSRDYRHGAAFKGRSVLVVGFGNSGAEIAVDLYEQGARPALAVRGAVNVIPRDICGIPVVAIAACTAKIPPAVSDFLFAPLLSLAIGDITSLGLRKLRYGPQQQIARERRVPLLDVDTLSHMRDGHIAVYPGMVRFTETGVVFEDGRELTVDAVIMATGYRPALHEFLPAAARVTDAGGAPLVSGRESPLPGLYFCGFRVSRTGMLREIGVDARRIAGSIATGRRGAGRPLSPA